LDLYIPLKELLIKHLSDKYAKTIKTTNGRRWPDGAYDTIMS